MDIYQEIWDADQSHAGVKAISSATVITDELAQDGYVLIEEPKPGNAPDFKLLTRVVIPDKKQESYERVVALFNNFTLDQTKPEFNTPAESQEVQSFIEAIYKSPPMNVARDFISLRTNSNISDDEWWGLIERVWFHQFDMGVNKDLSAFEHVIIGEQQQGKVQGYHFWYKYFCDEQFELNGQIKNLIKVIGGENNPEDKTPDVVTFKFQWEAFDYEAKKFRTLVKPIGGFWVGPSVEGIMAMGLVRFVSEADAPRQASINGALYNVKMFKSNDNKYMRTIYPEFVRMEN